MQQSLSFEGQVAIVTGAGGGLGREHALALAGVVPRCWSMIWVGL